MPKWVVLASWVAVFLGWAVQWRRAQRGRSESGRQVNHLSRVGMVFELGSFAALPFAPLSDVPAWVQWTGAAVAVGAAWLGTFAGWHLGRHLRMQAVVADGHRLVTTGPYSVVRHPIYACLLGFLVGTALAFLRPWGLAVALPLYFLGTEIRVRAEDKLLREFFGAEFEEYRRRVAAYLPGLR